MENFHIVSALCRQVIKDGPSSDAVTQMERLEKALADSGYEDEAIALKRLIEKANRKAIMEPSQLKLSKAALIKGQILTRNSKLPVDKDSGSPLARIIFQDTLNNIDTPIFPTEIDSAVNQLVDEWNSIDKLDSVGVKPSFSCLLYGLPGTGKTQLALYIAKKMCLPVVVAKLDGLVSSLLGTSARNINNLFNFVSQHQCILLLDEFDAVAKARDDAHEVGEIKRVVNTLLQCIDERAELGLTIAITNHEVLLDPAVWRRFDIRMYVPRPNLEARCKIIEKYMLPLNLSEEQSKFLSLVTEEFCGSDLELLSKNYKRHMVLSNQKMSFIDRIKSLFVINSSKHSELILLIREGDNSQVMYKLNKEFGFTQREISRVFETSLSRVSKSINDFVKSLT